jgi:nucleotide-binding universal stress UspA family protein
MYRTILVPLDGSKRAEAILPHVEQLANHYGARLVFLQVIEPVANSSYLAGPMPYISSNTFKQWETAAKTYLAGMRGEFREKNIEARIRVECGPVVRVIIDCAESEGADLVAMSSHGRTGLARVVYGSVAAGVLQRVDRPLLLIRS